MQSRIHLNESKSIDLWVHWILRIASAGCFIGHGAFGILTKSEWLPYFAIAHIGPKTAYTLMPLIGIMDIALGIAILIRPMRFVMFWMVVWTVWTAFCRPLAGQGIWEFFERAGNYGIPFAFLFWSGYPKRFSKWFSPVRSSDTSLDYKIVLSLIWILTGTTFLLLLGHGGFGAFQQKENLIVHWGSIGIPGQGFDPDLFITLIGIFEICLAGIIIFKPSRPLFIFIFSWKVLTELLYPISGTPIWEWIERFGSYGAPLAGFFLFTWLIRKDKSLKNLGLLHFVKSWFNRDIKD